MIAETDLETRGELFEIAKGDDERGSSGQQMDAGEYPYYIVPRPPVPGKTGWSIAAW